MTQPFDIYKNDIDFAALALQDGDFAKLLKSNGQLDFSNPECVQQLTKSLLKRDFGLSLTVPDDRLCPPVPNRLNYLLWIQNLLQTTNDQYNDTYDANREVLGLDIGTGASCIYPLLGCAQFPNWRFAGTDIDEKSLRFARQNVQNNKLQHRIKLLQTKPSSSLLPLDRMGIKMMEFCMCNPPFYESKAEMLASAAIKQRPPFTACTGSENEMVTTGGEVAFVTRLIDESLEHRDCVQWYTSMLGKFSSLPIIVQKLWDRGINNYAVTEFVQGSRTRRWGIAWSFDDLRPSVAVARGVSSLPKSKLPFPTEYIIILNVNALAASQKINEAVSQLPLKWMWSANILTGLGFSEKAVWSRASRRQRPHQDPPLPKDESTEMAFGFRIGIEGLPGGQPDSRVKIRWMKGRDSVLFESFCGMLKRKLEDCMIPQ